jgi:N-methylhydantoinase B
MCSFSCGGGGYGPPYQRDVHAVLHDISMGFIGRERAREVYGVVLDAQDNIDAPATAQRRAGLRAQRLGN